MKKIVIAAALFAFIATPATAGDLYAGIKLGSVNYGYSNVTNNDQVGFGLLGGYTINETFAVEVEYNDLGGFDGQNDTVKGSSIGVSGVGSYPLNPQFSIFGKLGVASSTLKATANFGGSATIKNTGVSVGFGGQYNISNQTGISVGIYVYPVGDATSNTSGASMMYVGVVFKF